MAVVERKRKKLGIVYSVAHEWQGRQVTERVGTNRREAEARDRAMKREIDKGTYQPKTGGRGVTLGQACEAWAAKRTNRSAGDERRLLRLHIHTRPWLASKLLDEVRPHPDVDRLVDELRSERKPDGSRRLTDKTIANLFGVLNLVFNAAVRADLCSRNPLVLEPGTLKRQPKAEKETYSPGEVAVLIRHHAIPWPIRILNALCLLAGLREGEACGRRWCDLDGSAGPLAAMAVGTQYGGLELKTERPRVVPVHRLLAELLTAWRAEGFEVYTGHAPEPVDYIVPNLSSWSRTRHHTRSSYYKAFVRYAEAAGVRPRSLHATRHTFITLCRRGGARKDVLERVTHNARGDIVDRYTHFDWEPLCAAVSCLNLDAHQDLPPGSENRGELRAAARVASRALPRVTAGTTVAPPGSIPGASTTGPGKNSWLPKPRQEKRQDSEENGAELRAANRARHRQLLSLQGADPEAAAPGLALCRALDAAYRVGAGDEGAEGDLLSALALAAERVFARRGVA
jgi:integrase